MPTNLIETDYLVVGAGAMGMAFTDALIDHADVQVTLVDRRFAPGGHWQDAYPFVQLHQASLYYGVASTELGTGAVQESGPEKGLRERARRAEIQHYYDDVLQRRFINSQKVSFMGGFEYQVDGSSHFVTSLVSGETRQIKFRRRLVDATYMSPTIPATTPPPFGAADGVRIIAINQLAALKNVPKRFVIVGAGKTATDGIVWLLTNGVSANRITWIRPREPWMLNRAIVQPDPVVTLQFATDIMSSAIVATSLDELFVRLEECGVMLRIDRGVLPTMAKAPTLGQWELDLLRGIEHVVRLGHVQRVDPSDIVLDKGVVALEPDSLIVHCAASGLAYPPVAPIWSPDKIRLQTVRAGNPCFGAAVAGFIEAIDSDDRERNAWCPPNRLSNSLAGWARMQAQGILAARAFGSEPDIASWADRCALNAAKVSPSQRDEPAVRVAASRFSSVVDQGIDHLAKLGNQALVA